MNEKYKTLVLEDKSGLKQPKSLHLWYCDKENIYIQTKIDSEEFDGVALDDSSVERLISFLKGWKKRKSERRKIR